MQKKYKNNILDQNSGFKNFFYREKVNEIRTDLKEFPRFRRKVLHNIKKNSTLSEKNLMSDEDITAIDMSSIIELSCQNQTLKKKIKLISNSIKNFLPVLSNNQPMNCIENLSKNQTQKVKRNFVNTVKDKNINTTILKDIIDSKTIPVKNSKWQKIIRKSPSLVDLSCLTTEKSSKSTSKVIDVGYPYCKSCKVNWNAFSNC